ncbi:unnamed protein product [Closterium sp. Naga37s-1]|nr:unnamed protein product [Closterium sp. Naga37s-1]
MHDPLPCCSAASLPLTPPPCAPLPPLSPPLPLPEQVRKQQGSSARRLMQGRRLEQRRWRSAKAAHHLLMKGEGEALTLTGAPKAGVRRSAEEQCSLDSPAVEAVEG